MKAGLQRFKWPLMLGALVIAAWLALFGDKTPPSSADVVEASAPLEPAAAEETPAEPTATVRPWVPREAARIQAWVDTPADPFRALNARPRAEAEAPATEASPPNTQPFTVIGRSSTQGHEVVHLLNNSDGETIALRVGSRTGHWRVQAITRDTLVMRRLNSTEQLKLPIGSPDGVFDVGTRHETE